MPRYIDAEKLMHTLGIADECKKCTFCIGAICTNENDFVDACTAIAESPTADVVEVVRCKDCTNWQVEWTPDSFPDGHYCESLDTMTTPTFYCADGERGAR